MASGTIKEHNIRSLPVSLIPNSGILFRSWGYSNAYVIGHLLILTIVGLYSDHDISAEEAAMAIDGIVSYRTIATTIPSSNSIPRISVQSNKNTVFVSGLHSGDNIMGQLVALIK